MAIDLTELVDYSFADLKLLAKLSMVKSAGSGEEVRMRDGRMVKRLPMDKAIELYNWANDMDLDEDDDSGGIVLARFGDPQ